MLGQAHALGSGPADNGSVKGHDFSRAEKGQKMCELWPLRDAFRKISAFTIANEEGEMLGAPGLDFETWDTTMLQKRIHAARDLAGPVARSS